MNINMFWLNVTMFQNVSTSSHYTSAIYLLNAGLFGTFLNILVIYFYVRDKILRKPSNYFFINLAITDLILIVGTVPMNIISSLYEEWIFGKIGCNLYGVLGGVSGFCSIATMVLISLERYWVVSKPMKSLNLNKNFVISCILGTWLYGLFWSILPLFGENQFVLEGFLTSCTFDYVSRTTLNRFLMLTMIIGGFIIPLSIIVISYILIVIELKKRKSFIEQMRLTSSSKPVDSDSGTLRAPQRKLLNLSISSMRQQSQRFSNESVNSKMPRAKRDNQECLSKTQLKTTKNVIILVLMFIVSWCPYCILVLIIQFVPNIEHKLNLHLASVAPIFAKTSAMINPIIYALRNARFRHILKRAFDLKQLPYNGTTCRLKTKILTSSIKQNSK